MTIVLIPFIGGAVLWQQMDDWWLEFTVLIPFIGGAVLWHGNDVSVNGYIGLNPLHWRGSALAVSTYATK